MVVVLEAGREATRTFAVVEGADLERDEDVVVGAALLPPLPGLVVISTS
jgi:hypothetical protein